MLKIHNVLKNICLLLTFKFIQVLELKCVGRKANVTSSYEFILHSLCKEQIKKMYFQII